MGGRVSPPFRSKRHKPGHSESVERLVPGPAGRADHLRDQGVEIDFPGSGDASAVAAV